MKHFQVTFKPDGKRLSVHAGATLLEAASQAGIILNTVCGGKGICKKCTVRLEPDGRKVLACQHHVTSDLTVTIPPESRFFEQKILARASKATLESNPIFTQNIAQAIPPSQSWASPSTSAPQLWLLN